MIFKYAINTYASGFSTVKLHNYFKSQNVKLSRQTINNFIKFGEETFLLYRLPQFFKGFKRSNQSRKKLYVVDNSLIGLFITEPQNGRLLENEVYLELLRFKERDPSVQIRYLNGKEGEIDFLVSRGDSLIYAIQVSYELTPSNMEREIGPLLKARDKLKSKRNIMITFNRPERDIQVGKGIEIMTFAEWALMETGKST